MIELKEPMPTSKTKVLLVDDNEQFLDVLYETLVDSGYDVVYAKDGKEAQNKFTDFIPDIVVTDIVMPEIDGIELLVSLRNLKPNIRIIAMSGGNSGYASSYLDMAENLGANVVLSKPFKLPRLLEEVKKLEPDV